MSCTMSELGRTCCSSDTLRSGSYSRGDTAGGRTTSLVPRGWAKTVSTTDPALLCFLASVGDRAGRMSASSSATRPAIRTLCSGDAQNA